LHDFGKFVQRGEQVILNHQEAGAKVIEKFPLPTHLEEHKVQIENLIGGHHYPEKYYSKPPSELTNLLNVLKEADRLSAKERQPLQEEEISESIFSTSLLSIFHGVRLEGKTEQGPAEEFYHNIMRLECGEAMLPETRKLPADFKKEYKGLLSDFRGEVRSLSKIEDLEAHFTTLYYLLMKYTFFVPSITANYKPDLSLFEHLSTTCAIAESLHRGKQGEILLIGGDFCRIQSFVYTITSEQAAKMLRGRAFYVYLLNKIIGYYILRKLELPISNMIFCSGGVFTILAPYTDENVKLLEKSVNEINEWLLKTFKGELYVAVAHLKVKAKELENFEEVLMKLGQRLEEEKLRQFMDLLPKEYNTIFGCNSEKMDKGRKAEICAVCKTVTTEPEKTADITVCKICKSFENFGSDLVKSNYLIMLTYNPLQPIKCDVNFEHFGFGYMFASNESHLKSRIEEASKSPSLKLINVIRLNSTDFIREELLQSSHAPIAFSFDFICRHVPLSSNETVESFDKIVKKSEGAQFLGVLRMDVDDLGEIFFRGLGHGVSISRITTMSRLLSTFFDGHLDWLIGKGDNYNEKVYVVYSGGDDLLFMGSWDAICDLSVEIQEKFSRMTSKNPNITISAGVILADPKWPVYRLADTSKDYLEHSKSKTGKNSITIFGDESDYTVSWDNFERLKDLKEELFKKVKSKVLSRNFLLNLRSVHRLYESEIKKRNKKAQRYKWLLRYIIARQISQRRELTDELLNLESKINNCIESLDIPVIWTDLQTRSNLRGE